MGAVSTSLVEEARSIFTDLGYEVTDDGEELRAERKWRTVRVTTAEPEKAASRTAISGAFARAEQAPDVRQRLLAVEPEYDWAVISVDEEDYRVLHPDADVLPAP